MFSNNPEDPLPKRLGAHAKRALIWLLLALTATVAGLMLRTIVSNNDAQATQEVEETVLEAEKIVPVEVNIISEEPVDDSADPEGMVITTTPLENPSNSTALKGIEFDAVKWFDNPNNCDQELQYIAAQSPFACIDKPVVDAMANTTIPSEPAVEEEVNSSEIPNSSVECDLETQWISAEEPQYCIDKPVETEPVVEEVVETIAETTETVSVPPTETMEPVKADCDDATQWWSGDYSYCIDKPMTPVVQAAAVVAPTPVASVGVSGSCDSYRGLVAQYSWNVDTMMYAMFAESGCNPYAVGDQYVINGVYAPSCGLLQVRTLAGRPSCEALKDPATNIAASYDIWLTQSYGAWSTLH